jgi:hypothetical protein
VRTSLAALGLAAALCGRAAADAAPVVLDDGALEARLTLGAAVIYQGTSQILSVAPDVWWGATPRWTVGLVHSGPSLDQIDPVATLCLRDPATSSCPRWYAGGGLDVRYAARTGELAVAPRLRLIVRNVSPWKPAATVGALVRWTHGRFAIAGDPYVRAPLANHTQGNRAALFAPVWLEVAPAARWRVFLHTGYDVSFATLRDGGHIPLALGLTAPLSCAFDVGVEAGWAALLGPQHNAKEGAVLVSVGWHR